MVGAHEGSIAVVDVVVTELHLPATFRTPARVVRHGAGRLPVDVGLFDRLWLRSAGIIEKRWLRLKPKLSSSAIYSDGDTVIVS